MIVITNHKTLNKLKIFHNCKNCKDFYNNILINRNIAAEDLDIYRVLDGTKILLDKGNFIFENDTTLKIFTKKLEYTENILSLKWHELSEDDFINYYTEEEINLINQNKQITEENWLFVKDAEIKYNTLMQVDELIQTIEVEKLNPFE